MKFFGKFIRGKGFEYLFAFFSFLSVFYVSDRMGRLTASLFHHDFSGVIFLILMLFMGYMFFYIKSKKEKKATRSLYELCSVVICFLLYLILALWAYDLADLIFSIHQDQLYLLPVLLSVVLVFYGFFHARKLYVKEYQVTVDGQEKEETLVLLSDIHVGSFVDFDQLKKIVSTVNEVHPDKILIAGDLFDVDAFAYCDKEKIAEILRGFGPKGNIYAVLGNHDPASSTFEMQKFYKKADIRLLLDESFETESCVLVGRDDITTNPNRKALTEILPRTKKPSIVIDHNPLGISEGVENHVDLVVCGHTHRGQFFPANIFTCLAYGKQGYYGYFKEKETQSIVSSGAGFFQMPMRIGSNSEIVVIHLENQRKNAGNL